MEYLHLANLEKEKQYKQKHNLPIYVNKTLNAIEKCRTAELGAHEDVCDYCGHKKISYNSCRNRHCPKCLTSAKEKWIYNQKFDVLNVQYFHVVFTIPDELNKVVYYNQTKMYNVLFKSVSETLQQLGNDKKYLGAQIGFTSILHTWGQNRLYDNFTYMGSKLKRPPTYTLHCSSRRT